MPFEGGSIPAPIMASKQGMMDAALHGVTDQARPVVQYVAGAFTGKGSGLLQPVTQSAGDATQSALSQVAQTGQAATIGKGEFWGAGQATGTAGDSWSGALAQAESGGGNAASLVGAMAGVAGGGMGGGGMAGLAAAQSMLGGSGLGGAGGLGSASALAGSGALAGMGAGGVGSSSAAAGAGAMGSPSSPAASSGLAPGTLPTPPQFTALPQIPSLHRLADVISKVGAMLGPAGSVVAGMMAGGSGGDGGGVGSGMEQPPANQFAGQGQAADYQADS